MLINEGVTRAGVLSCTGVIDVLWAAVAPRFADADCATSAL